jgi:CheY-like chemotaxis protein
MGMGRAQGRRPVPTTACRNGTESIDILRQKGLDIPVIAVSGSLGEPPTVECIKQGAAESVLKDGLARLPVSVTKQPEYRGSRA